MLSHWTKNKANNTEPEQDIRSANMPDGTVRITLTQRGDKQRAQDALRALIKATKNIKPDPNNGGAAAIRALRDAS